MENLKLVLAFTILITLGFTAYWLLDEKSIESLTYNNRGYRASWNNIQSKSEIESAQKDELIATGDFYRGREIFVTKDSSAYETDTIIWLSFGTDQFKSYELLGGP